MTECNRRRFLQLAGSASLLSAAGGRLGWASSQRNATGFVYIGSEDAIHMYSISAQEHLLKRQTISSARPVAMAIHNGRLYAANSIAQHGNLPRGTVEAYTIDAATGELELLDRVPLSLSGVDPRDLAIAPDGRSLVVAIHGGGAYNVLSIDEDGHLKVTGILKEIGSGPHPLQTRAHPSAIVFDREGRVLAADQGCDRLSVFAFSDGEMKVKSRYEVSPGAGPSSIVLHPDGQRVFVAHAFDGSVSSFAYGATAILDCRQTIRASDAGSVATLALHPSGEMLYSSHGAGLRSWKIAADGSLKLLPGIECLRASTLHITPDGMSLLALTSDAVFRIRIDALTHLPATPVKVASLSNPISIATGDC